MTVDQLRAQLQAQPFTPFNIRLADGRSIPVLHPEYTIISPRGRTAIVYQPNDDCNIVDVQLVIDLELKPGTATQNNNP
jgi:hypothetical protein